MPQIFDLWQDPQERYDIFMNNYTEHTWTLVTFNQAIHDLMQTYVKYPPRKAQSETYTGPITLSAYQRFQWVAGQAEGGRLRPADADRKLRRRKRNEVEAGAASRACPPPRAVTLARIARTSADRGVLERAQ